MWWTCLRDLGHDVTSYGQGGSSLMWSVRLLQKHAAEYDMVIWCATMPGRLSVQTKHMPYPDNWVHWRAIEPIDTKFSDVRRQQEIFQQYYLELVDIEEDNLAQAALIHHMMTLHPHMMVIPCFPPPLKLPFNLYDLSCWEMRPLFDNEETWRDWYRYYTDVRPGHLTHENHRRLAAEINANLRPGIFQTTLDKFVQVNDFNGVLMAKR